jgi:hypothetical protein
MCDVLSVLVADGMERLVYQKTNFHEVSYWECLLTSRDQIQI